MSLFAKHAYFLLLCKSALSHFFFRLRYHLCCCPNAVKKKQYQRKKNSYSTSLPYSETPIFHRVFESIARRLLLSRLPSYVFFSMLSKNTPTRVKAKCLYSFTIWEKAYLPYVFNFNKNRFSPKFTVNFRALLSYWVVWLQLPSNYNRYVEAGFVCDFAVWERNLFATRGKINWTLFLLYGLLFFAIIVSCVWFYANSRRAKFIINRAATASLHHVCHQRSVYVLNTWTVIVLRCYRFTELQDYNMFIFSALFRWYEVLVLSSFTNLLWQNYRFKSCFSLALCVCLRNCGVIVI